MTLSRDLVIGVLAVLVASAYYVEATRIQHSMLSDAVGADGVPLILAVVMAAVGLALAARGLLQPCPEADSDVPMRTHMRAAGLLAIVIVYMLVLPIVGYPISVAGLIAAVATYAGARPSLALAATAVGGAAVLWLMFHWLLGVAMPVGVLSWG